MVEEVLARRAIAVGIPALTGLMLGLLMPRGPVTTPQAVVVLIVGMAAGIGAGYALGSRWSMLLAPVAYVVAYELIRVGAQGPTVDGIQLGTAGVMALVAGRGFHGLVGVVPIVIGAAYGAGLSRGAVRPHLGTAIGLVVVIAIAAWIVRPAGTPAIAGPDGDPLPGSIAVLEEVTLGGHDQWISIRGDDAEAPVLLFLTGGPGGSQLGYNRPFFRELEHDMVVVQWDQRGTGKSYAALEPRETMTVDAVVADTIELSEYLRDRFGEDRIYLLGNSWGTTLGVLSVQRRPDLFHAYIGSGQMVSQRVTDQRLYGEMLAWADENDPGLAGTLRAQGPPPYEDVSSYAPLLITDWQRVYPFRSPPDAMAREAETGTMGVFASEYSLVEKANVIRGLFDTFDVLYPQLQDVDFRRDVPRLDLPVYLVQGRHEMGPRAELVPEWFEALEAPDKELVVFPDSGHNPYNSEFARFRDFMVDTVLAETYPD